MQAVEIDPETRQKKVESARERHAGSKIVEKVSSATKLVSSKARQLRKWLRRKGEKRGANRAFIIQKKSSLTNLKKKANRTLEDIKDAAASAVHKLYKPAPQHQLEKRILSNAANIPTMHNVQIELSPEQEQKIRHEEIDLLLREEEVDKKNLGVTLKTIEEHQGALNKLLRAEATKRNEIEANHNQAIKEHRTKINQLRMKSAALEKEIDAQLKLVYETKSPEEEKKLRALQSDNSELNRKLDALWRDEAKMCEEFEKMLDVHDNRVKRQREQLLDKISKYKNALIQIEISLEQKIVVRRALEDQCYEDGHIHSSSLAARKQSSPCKGTPDGRSSSSSYSIEEDSGIIRKGLERQTVMKDAAYRIRQAQPKELTDEGEISDIEGYSISEEKLGETALSVVLKARVNLFRDEGALLAARIVDLQDPRVEQHLKANGMKILQYICKNPFRTLIRVNDVMIVGDKFFIFEELVDKPLEQIIKLEGPQNETLLYSYAHQIGYGLSFLHDIGVAHQNLSPTTVFKTSSGLVKIGCLESAVICYNPDTSKTIFRKAVGNSSGIYTAPEVFTKYPYDPTMLDVYCFGLLMLYMYFAENPVLVPKRTPTQVPWCQMSSKLREIMSPELQDVLLHCLNTDVYLRKPIRKVLVREWFQKKDE